jgi:ABC-type transport system substrate-binding protein
LKNILTAAILSAALLFASACSSTGTANKTTNTAANTTTTTTNSSTQTTTPANTANTATTANSSNTTAANQSSSSSAANSDEGGKQDFLLVNATDVEINKLYISPHDKDDWEEDILGRDTLPSGEQVEIKFHRDEKPALWDLRVEDSKGNAIEWENLNLLEISKVTLHYKNGRATAETE